MDIKSITLEFQTALAEGIQPIAMDPPDPSIIVRKAQAGDLEAFEWLIGKHERQVLGLCYHVLGNLEDAKDAAQDVFLKLHQQIGRFDYEREFTPWLLTVVRNLCRDRLRARRPLEQLDHLPLADVARDPEALARFGQEWAMLKQAIDSLPQRERAALEMRELEEMSNAEVAARLGVTEETVRSQVSKAKVKLKRLVRSFL